jgi:cytochrome c
MLSTTRYNLPFFTGTGKVHVQFTGNLSGFFHGEKVMKASLLVFLAAGVLVSNAAMANADLAKAKNCLACHAVANKVVGPAFKDVAAKYAGQKDAEDKLTQKVLKGGSGVWGAVPMPANAQVNEAEARTLVKWVLSQK